MDPITHGLLGAAAGAACFAPRLGRAVFPIAILAGMAPDLDIFIRSPGDPLISMLYHRHFTHALAFIPIGALLVTLPLLCWPTLRKQFKWVYLTALVAMATHGLLDCLTSYGTLWLWPFSYTRVAFDSMSIIDPIVTGVLFLGVLLAWVGLPPKRGPSPRCVQIALLLVSLYMLLGIVQNQRGLALQHERAQARGHVIERGRVMPTLGNLILWRSVYQHQGRLYADALRLPLWSSATIREGESVQRYTAHHADHRYSPVLDRVARFEWFADGYLARTPDQPNILGDMRYSMITQGFSPLWGLQVTESPKGELTQATVVHLRMNRREAVRRMLEDLGISPESSTPELHVGVKFRMAYPFNN